MTVAELKARVEKAAANVEKAKKTIERHEAQLNKKIAAGADAWEIDRKRDDIRGATKKLESAQEIYNNWTAKYNVALEKERFLNNNVPEVIKNFLEQWKKKAFDWSIKRYNDTQDFRKQLNTEETAATLEYINNNLSSFERYLVDGAFPKERLDWVSSRPSKGLENFLKEKRLDWKSIKTRVMNFAGGTVLKMEEFHIEEERLAWLDKDLEREKQNKMMDLINRVNAVVGSITDASHLEISAKGNLDGVVIGTEGSAQVETIGAGGWNIQCFHYRTLVKPFNGTVKYQDEILHNEAETFKQADQEPGISFEEEADGQLSIFSPRHDLPVIQATLFDYVGEDK